MNPSLFQTHLGIVRQVVKLQLLFLLVLSLFRLAFFWRFSPHYDVLPAADLAKAFWLGLRVDSVLVSYLTVVPLLLLLGNTLLRGAIGERRLVRVLVVYFIAAYLGVSFLLAADFGFYSFFGEHITIMIFGFFDDDTKALIQIALKNYNVALILAAAAVYAAAIVWVTVRILRRVRPVRRRFSLPAQAGVWIGMTVLVVLGARGSLGLFPLIKDIPDVSADRFVNALPKSGVFAFEKAYKQYRKSKAGEYDLIAKVGYKGNIAGAFSDFLGRSDVNLSDPFRAIARRTPVNPAAAQRPPHVVVVMVESFGAPILKYQSPSFDIMRRLKKHFDADIVFTHFISGSNGTIVSLEPLLLNLYPRPESVAYGQSRYLGVSFPTAAAAVYKKAGYETSFVYGGDLSWRNVGSFFARQGFDHVEGKSAIEAALPEAEEHDWGVYDKHAYDFVLQKLRRAKRPQFVFLLTTNNHPPYVLSKHYTPKPLHFSAALKKHLIGDLELAHRRFQDYQYALDMAGRFMDRIKDGALAEQTVVAITADNNTVEGIMHYDDTVATSKKVPFYLYLPPYLRREPFDRSVSASHKDILPTLYARTLSHVLYRALGTDLYDPSVLHCGYNDEGIVVSAGGAFRMGHAHGAAQKACERHCKAGLAVTQYLVEKAAK